MPPTFCGPGWSSLTGCQCHAGLWSAQRSPHHKSHPNWRSPRIHGCRKTHTHIRLAQVLFPGQPSHVWGPGNETSSSLDPQSQELCLPNKWLTPTQSKRCTHLSSFFRNAPAYGSASLTFCRIKFINSLSLIWEEKRGVAQSHRHKILCDKVATGLYKVTIV